MVTTLFYYIDIFMLIVGGLHKKSGNFKFEMPLYRQSEDFSFEKSFFCVVKRSNIGCQAGSEVDF
jgi:hypothetical protein